MGFDPSTIRRPEPKIEKPGADAPREARVLSLANELHRRGVTVSLADAKRLAEGMVDIERKVIDEGSRKVGEARPVAVSDRVRAQSDPIFRSAGVAPPVSAPVSASATSVPSLKLPTDFARFVDRTAGASTAAQPAASVTPATTSRPVTQYGMNAPSPREAPRVYGRNEEYAQASVPHASARKQMFFDDAPPMTQLRGFQKEGSLPEGLKYRGFKGTETKAVPVAAIPRAPEPVVPSPAPYVSPAPQPRAFEPAPEPEPVPVFAAEPEPEAMPVSEPEPVPEPVAQEKPKEDLAKQHGVDIFQMFKVNK